MSWQTDYVDRYYRSRPGWIDGTTQFHRMCARHLRPGARILEVGAGGEANRTGEFLARSGSSLTGLDVDEAVRRNPHLGSAVVYDGGAFPFSDASFDAVVSDYVLEHVDRPATMLQEICRVLAAGGVFLFRTPNVCHYVSIAGRLLPDRLSIWARNRAPDHRVFPRRFRFNSESVCRRLLQTAGFDLLELELIEKEPSYGMRSRLLFFPMLAYERLVNSLGALRFLRANILCAARRREAAP